MANLITEEGYDFTFDPSTCSRCPGTCCLGDSGYVWVTTSEIKKLSTFLNITVDTLHKYYLTKYQYKYSINEIQLAENSYACIFFDLDKKRCSIYDVRPTQCRTFPFWEQYQLYKDDTYFNCPAVKHISTC